jgi:hypothetical protein
MFLLVAVGATFAFAGKLWASALQPRSIVLLPQAPLFPPLPRPHLTAPRIVVPASPSVAAHLGVDLSGRGATSSRATRRSHSGHNSSTVPNAQASGASAVRPAEASGNTASGPAAA